MKNEVNRALVAKKRLFLFCAMCLMALGALAESQPNAVRFEQDNGKDFYMLNATVTMPEAYTGTTITIDGQTYDISENSVKTYFCEIGTYTRDVADGSWGTLCLPWESVKLEGGDFYNVLGTKHAEKGVALTPIEAPDQLEAGKPYVFKATSEQIKVTYDPSTEVEDEVEGNHIIGSFAGCPVPNGMYIIYNNLLYITNGSSTIGANRAYFDADNMEAYNPATAPARVVFMGGHQAPTSLGGEADRLRGKKVIKVIENGQFRIIRDGKTYNAQGIEL